MKLLGVSRVAKGFAYRAERLALHGFSLVLSIRICAPKSSLFTMRDRIAVLFFV